MKRDDECFKRVMDENRQGTVGVVAVVVVDDVVAEAKGNQHHDGRFESTGSPATVDTSRGKPQARYPRRNHQAVACSYRRGPSLTYGGSAAAFANYKDPTSELVPVPGSCKSHRALEPEPHKGQVVMS